MSDTVNRLNENQAIYEAIRKIAFHKLVNPYTGVTHNTEKIQGYVTKVHTDPSDELCGTIDVQEYSDPLNRKDIDDGVEVGYHEGVYLSAIQNNANGLVIIPFLNSDVVIVTDPLTLKEYVIEYSHADKVQIDAHSEVIIGVTETKPYSEDDDVDYDELEPTKNRAHTKYTPTSALIEVAKGDKPEEKSSINVTADNIISQHDKTQLMLDAKQLLAKYNAREIVIKDDAVYLGAGDAKEPAVLGNQLAQLLIDWLTALSQVMTPTMMGPQPPANLAQFVQLQAKVNSFKAATSGILSKTVKVKE